MECEFCKKTFSTKPNLITHQKTAKYCLEIQGETNTLFKCEYCEKYFTCNQRLNEHVTNICKIKYKYNYEQEVKKLREEMVLYKKQEKTRLKDKELLFDQQRKFFEKTIEDKNDYISKLEAKLEKFEDIVLSKTEKKPYTTTTNNTTNNIVINNSLNLNDIEKMNSFLDEKLDKEVLAGGQKSFALLMSSTMLKDKYKCVDPSRQNFEFTNELGEIERDVKAKKLTTAIIKSNIRSRSGEKGEELWTKEDGSTDSLRFQANSKNVLEMMNFDMDNSTFRSELSALT